MSALTRFERMDDLFGEFFRRMGRMPALPAELPQDIRLDVTESDKAYTVKAEMPGARKEDIRVSLDGNQLTIAAEVRRDTEKKDRETTQGSIARGLTLAYEVDESQAKAKYENGVLEMTLPKRREAQGRQITVS